MSLLRALARSCSTTQWYAPWSARNFSCCSYDITIPQQHTNEIVLLVIIIVTSISCIKIISFSLTGLVGSVPAPFVVLAMQRSIRKRRSWMQTKSLPIPRQLGTRNSCPILFQFHQKYAVTLFLNNRTNSCEFRKICLRSVAFQVNTFAPAAYVSTSRRKMLCKVVRITLRTGKWNSILASDGKIH